MNLALVSFLTTDKLQLPGLLYTPAVNTQKVLVWLHGMGDSGAFYSPTRINELGEALTERGIALFAFNNRGAHNSKSLSIVDDTLPEEDRRYQGGTYYEKIEDCIKDIDGAATFLQARGFNNFYLGGHSSGANKICVYDDRAAQNLFEKYVLAAPGDDIGGLRVALGKEQYEQARHTAQQLIDDNQALATMPEASGMYPFSAQSAKDILDPDGAYNTFPFYEATTERLGSKELFAEYKKLSKPVLVVYGDADEYTDTAGGAATALSILTDAANPAHSDASSFVLIPDTDHGFHGAEETLATVVAEWLS